MKPNERLVEVDRWRLVERSSAEVRSKESGRLEASCIARGRAGTRREEEGR